MVPDETVARLQAELGALHLALATLVCWMAQSANSPITRNEATLLLRMADGGDEPEAPDALPGN